MDLIDMLILEPFKSYFFPDRNDDKKKKEEDKENKSHPAMQFQPPSQCICGYQALSIVEYSQHIRQCDKFFKSKGL